jgi:hypothetical protein
MATPFANSHFTTLPEQKQNGAWQSAKPRYIPLFIQNAFSQFVPVRIEHAIRMNTIKKMIPQPQPLQLQPRPNPN